MGWMEACGGSPSAISINVIPSDQISALLFVWREREIGVYVCDVCIRIHQLYVYNYAKTFILYVYLAIVT